MCSAPVYLTEGIRALEAAALRLPGAPRLMERAGLAAAQAAESLLDGRRARVLVFAGPGNNGGDAFELATHLKQRFYRVEIVFLGNAARLSADAACAYAKWRNTGGRELAKPPEVASIRRNFDLLVDGLFGIGLARALEGRHANAVASINASGLPVLALDVPSGIHSDSGAIMGCAVRATRTLTFIAQKPGLLTLDGPDHCGELQVDALGLDVQALLTPGGGLLDASTLRGALIPRARNFHKGNAGDVLVLGGATGMVGAALLAGRAALACGAGRVHVGLLDDEAPRVDLVQPELMLRRAQDVSLAATVVAAGPGMGQSEAARAWLRTSLDASGALILDADALNLLAQDASLARAASSRHGPTLMTPHPAEAARLLACSTADIQRDRLAAALELARRFNAHAALKGNGTVIASPDGRWWINSSGHPGMASAGMGDTLTGMIASLVAQGAEPLRALCAAVWLHGAAGDALAIRQGGPLGTLAGDLAGEARLLLNHHVYSAR